MISLALAAVLTATRGSSFSDSFKVSLIATGAILVVLGALGIGGGSPTHAVVAAYGKLVPSRELEPAAEAGPKAVGALLLTGLWLIGAGVLVDAVQGTGQGARGAAAKPQYSNCVEDWSPGAVALDRNGFSPRDYHVAYVTTYVGSPGGQGCSYTFHDDRSFVEIDVTTGTFGEAISPPVIGQVGILPAPTSSDLLYNALLLSDGRLRSNARARVLRPSTTLPIDRLVSKRVAEATGRLALGAHCGPGESTVSPNPCVVAFGSGGCELWTYSPPTVTRGNSELSTFEKQILLSRCDAIQRVLRHRTA
jgi:hypothetical protein